MTDQAASPGSSQLHEPPDVGTNVHLAACAKPFSKFVKGHVRAAFVYQLCSPTRCDV